jgi:hypothetical protein
VDRVFPVQHHDLLAETPLLDVRSAWVWAPGARLRDTAASAGITERSAHGVVTDLTEAGYVVKQEDGRKAGAGNESACTLAPRRSTISGPGAVASVILRRGGAGRRTPPL